MFRSACLLAALAMTACAAPEQDVDDGAEEDDAALVEARVAAFGELASLVRIDSNCTAAKIGPRLLLTAAHCIRTARGDVQPSFVAGREIPVLVQSEDGKGTELRVKIESSRVHPRTAEVCAASECVYGAATAKRDAPDIALIKATKEIPGVAAMPIDAKPASVGEIAMATGFGCTDGAFSRKGDDGRLRTAPTTVVEASAAVHEGSPLSPSEATNLNAVFAYTAGPGMKNGGGAGLCPGDSGGPLVRIGAKGRLSVIGVNASYTFRFVKDDPLGRAVTNWHSRVDAGARHDVFAWLKSNGATVAP